jgi:hypothetical protein
MLAFDHEMAAAMEVGPLKPCNTYAESLVHMVPVAVT